MHKVDVLLATYNGEKYIAQQIESILNQTYKNFKLIIFDDKSEDKTVHIIKKIMKRDSRIILKVNEKNIGYNKNFEKLISYSNADFMAICDQDDIWLDCQLELLIDHMLDNNCDISYGLSQYIDYTNNPINIYPYVKSINLFNTYQIFDDNIIPGRNMLINKRLKEFILPFPYLSRNFIYDWYIALVALQVGTVGCCNQTINYYRVHEQSVTNDSTLKKIKKYTFREKIFNIEKMRFQAINSRLERIQIFNQFITDKKNLQDYENYINSLLDTKFINLKFNSFSKYMQVRTPRYKIIFLIILHFPGLYRVILWKKFNIRGKIE